MKLAITGTSGFVGSRFLEYNSAKYTFLKLSLRDFLIEDLDLVNVGAVLHLAGKAHQMKAIEDNIYFRVTPTETIIVRVVHSARDVRHLSFHEDPAPPPTWSSPASNLDRPTTAQ